MGAAPLLPSDAQAADPRSVTLLEVGRAIGEVTVDDHEVVATVLHLLATGQIRLQGNVRGAGASDLS